MQKLGRPPFKLAKEDSVHVYLESVLWSLCVLSLGVKKIVMIYWKIGSSVSRHFIALIFGMDNLTSFDFPLRAHFHVVAGLFISAWKWKHNPVEEQYSLLEEVERQNYFQSCLSFTSRRWANNKIKVAKMFLWGWGNFLMPGGNCPFIIIVNLFW